MSAGKCHKQYVGRLKSKSKTCLIHGLGNFSDEYKVLGEFRTKYAKIQTTEDCESNPVPRKILHKNLENKAIINNPVENILQNETKRVSDVNNKAL